MAEIFPELQTAIASSATPQFASITLKQLLSHSSGINDTDSDPRGIAMLTRSLSSGVFSPKNLRYWILTEWIKETDPPPMFTQQHKDFHYSDIGYMVAGAMIERAAGKPWEELMVEKIFAPLGLHSAGFGPQSSVGKIDAPLSHMIIENKVTAVPAGYGVFDTFLAIGPAGTVHMSLQDMAKWIGWYAGKGERGPHIISSATFTKLMTPVVRDEGSSGPGRDVQYCLGWYELNDHEQNSKIYMHECSDDMNKAIITLIPESDFGVVVVTNIAGSKATETLFELTGALTQRYNRTPASSPVPSAAGFRPAHGGYPGVVKI
ncbi:MAG: beta-lactamase family protein [Oligoflexia bacterium]|nr:beta-lactamase family protein [Oligoflexia bacterium]